MAGVGTGKAVAAAAVGIPAGLLLYLRLKYPTIREDISLIRRQLALLALVEDKVAQHYTVLDNFEENAANVPNKPFILYKHECHTYGQVEREANKMAHYVQGSRKLKFGDTVAFLLPNAPMYVWNFLAFNKLGITTALLNYNLKPHALLHCIQISDAKVVLCSEEYLPVLKVIQEDLQNHGIEIWLVGHDDMVAPPGMRRVDTRQCVADPIPREVRKDVNKDTPAMYIYTSGTTGLPKAVNVTSGRLIRASYTTQPLELEPDDVIYTALPIYHSAGFQMGVCTAIRAGCTVAIAPKFSASHYWDDVRRYRATVVQYIGELCRYLLAQPPRVDDGKYAHKVRFALGNGLRPDIWAEFQKRFNIEHIREFYAATEGNFILMNLDDREGSVGRYPKLVHDLRGYVEIIKCDLATAEPIRGKDGCCISLPRGEMGLMVNKIEGVFTFEGYKGSKAVSEKKIIRDVVKKGDQFYNTGDLMMIDNNGYVYFCDRLGDTFRWKGENVATTEVAEELNRFPSVLESNVYGVQIPGHDGRAGMAAITLREGASLDPQQFYKHVKENLPLYACPKFIRIMPQMTITGTFKHKKTDLVKEGFDPSVVSDPLYFMDVGKETYVPLDQQVFKTVVIGKAKL
ncbi:long-chain fatty acid transport protein 2-like [Amphiura filiformis]|uniref:long-chain fatty acid transport protein 2-like n=1 Tax=Amphiura filiformis TaxID=82378 RepID=UPI003B215C83